MNNWRLSRFLWGFLPSPRLAARGAILLLVGLLLTSTLVFRPPAAQAHQTTAKQQQAATVQTQDGAIIRQDVFAILNGNGHPYGMYHKWSDDQGANWYDWENLGRPDGGLIFLTKPTMVSYAPGHLELFVIAGGPLIYNVPDEYNIPGTTTFWSDTIFIYSNVFNHGQWSGWFQWSEGFVSFGDSHGYHFMGGPAATSWGPGRMDLFEYGVDENGAVALLHNWADQGVWSGHWEVLGTGTMPHSPFDGPAAVSWGSGRVDVFVRGGGNELDHKWFDDGHWSSGWEDLGGTLTSSPTVASWQPGHLVVFARDQAGGLSARGYWGCWYGWSVVDDSVSFFAAPIVSTFGTGTWDVFARSTNFRLLHKGYNNSWSNWAQLDDNGVFIPEVVVWDPVAVSYPPPPHPTTCGLAGQPPCPRDP
jgi:hypothetical protein